MTDSPVDEPPKVECPSTISALWGVAFVANNEDEAFRQAERQYGPFAGQVIAVTEITGFLRDDDLTGDLVELDLTDPIEVRVTGLDVDGGWDDGVLFPRWDVTPVDGNATVTDRDDGYTVRLGDLKEMQYMVPGIGTAEGFDRKDRLIYPVHVPPTIRNEAS